MQFVPFDKIPRLRREMTVTEKLDGTNASIYIGEGEIPAGALAVRLGEVNQWMVAGSRTRWIDPTDDNFGFAAWAKAEAEEGDLFNLGPGHHFGEWWGRGIQRNYAISERRFSLFNTARWACSRTTGADLTNGRVYAPHACHVVPLLLQGPFRTDAIDSCLELLNERGSYAAHGFMEPEGLIVWHDAARQMFKVTCRDDDKPKGQK